MIEIKIELLIIDSNTWNYLNCVQTNDKTLSRIINIW